MHKIKFLTGLACLLLLASGIVQAKNFKLGEIVFVAFPAENVKDDAFIVGKVEAITKPGDYQLSVIEYVEGHDYGVSCTPMVKSEVDQGYGTGWEVWKDTTKLDTQRLDYIVPKENVWSLAKGRYYFIDRNNIYIVFGRWKSDAPMLTNQRMKLAQEEAKKVGLEGMIPALDLAIKHRSSYYYTQNNRPYRPYETIKALNDLVSEVQTILKDNKQLKAYWRSKERDWEIISQDSYHYFMIQAIDKILLDAKYQILGDDMHKADPKALKELTQKIKLLQRF